VVGTYARLVEYPLRHCDSEVDFVRRLLQTTRYPNQSPFGGDLHGIRHAQIWAKNRSLTSVERIAERLGIDPMDLLNPPTEEATTVELAPIHSPRRELTSA
jgi:hypothetical protein